MATGNQNLTGVTESLKKQLALAVTGLQWSYGIFWSISAKQPGALEWGGGYYNGDIKTRKTVEIEEMNSDQLGIQRTDQLRELYESLYLGETTPQPQRPTAALSPEDLTDSEWYFLICMSFVFNSGQGLPGRALMGNETVWLSDAHRMDTKSFSRSLFAKSASIKTVVCFPHLGGVVELGTTELAQEDVNLIPRIKALFLDRQIPSTIGSNEPVMKSDRILSNQETDIFSPINSPEEFADNILRVDPNLFVSLSDCVSQTLANPETGIPISDNHVNDPNSHYQSVLSSILKSSQHLILGPYFRRNRNGKSSFVCWNNRISCFQSPKNVKPQRLLKKVLFEVGRMHENSRVESGTPKNDRKEDVARRVGDEVEKNHVLSERRRREKMNERFMILGSLVPSRGKVDKVSVLDHTIDYLRELETKAKELESYKEVIQLERKAKELESYKEVIKLKTTQSKPNDVVERTSDNYGPNVKSILNKPTTSKRKVCGTEDKTTAVNKKGRVRDSTTDSVIVKVTEMDVVIDIRCAWRETVLVEAMKAITKLYLDLETVQSSNTDGILSISIKAKFKGLKGASASVIRQALERVIIKS